MRRPEAARDDAEIRLQTRAQRRLELLRLARGEPESPEEVRPARERELVALRERPDELLRPGGRAGAHVQPTIAVGGRQDEASHRPSRLLVALLRDGLRRRVDALNLR